ncbi:hypothetical protein DPMN_045145 [Dreissena polymorpha]|uniref:Uncharacterized protein n=1 Tax=Dreissena polymorpha TaxID=45954 RepID=A0A9D4D3L1_DREPO|nr:hypothetical protein DPMN_045145 [Dreissena polymorpha]
MWTGGRRTNTNPKTSPEQSAIFQLVREINKTNVLTKFHDEKTAPPLWQPCFLTDRDHLQTHLIYIYINNLFTKLHDDWAKHVTSRVHVIQLTRTVFELNSHIKETSVLTKFHENWAKIVTSRVFTCFHYIHIENNAPPTGGHISIKINFTNFHDNWAKIETSRVFTMKTAPPTGGHVFQRNGTTFELNQHIFKTNILIKIHEDCA